METIEMKLELNIDFETQKFFSLSSELWFRKWKVTFGCDKWLFEQLFQYYDFY